MIVSPLFVLTLSPALAEEPVSLVARPAFVGAVAEDDEEDADEEEDDDGSTKKKKSSKGDDERRIREIVRGFYAKANIGAAAYLLNFGDKGSGNAVGAGTLVGFSFGQDFVDTEKQSMAWELTLNQGIHNGLALDPQTSPNQTEVGCDFAAGGGGGYPCTEGDLRTYSLQATYEFSAYPIRRIGIGFRAGGGALYSPLLIDPTSYTEVVIPAMGGDPQIHNSIHPYGVAGLTMEYYTKLSHFSIGIDAEAFYAVGWDLGFNGSAALKYTF